jgi:G3E family GTPase
MLWGGHRVPFTLLGGYLGAGKTTIVNRVLRERRAGRLVVLVNDIGAVDVDVALIADHDGSTMSLTNGCVCCSIADDFGHTLETIRAMPEPPDQVLMELSGVAEPARVAPWANTAGFRLDGIIVAADAEQVAAQAARPDVGDTVVAQLAAGDLVVLTKTDLVDDGGAAATAFIASVTDAPVTESAGMPPSLLIGADHTAHIGSPSAPFAPATDRYVVADTEFAGGTRDELERLLAELPSTVIRAKGLVRCSDVDSLIEVHVVGRRRTVRELSDGVDTEHVGRLVTIAVAPR